MDASKDRKSAHRDKRTKIKQKKSDNVPVERVEPPIVAAAAAARESSEDDESATVDVPSNNGEASGTTTPPKTFAELALTLMQGIVESLCEACESLNYKHPTPIQEKSIPVALEGRDIIGLAETGSGKTAAFALPMLQALLDKPQPLFGLVLAPTRELATQIGQAFEALGALISLRCAVIVGGLDMVPQAIALSKKPHVIVATPGRLVDHLEKTKGFSLRTLKYLVMDEADRLLDMDFGPSIDRLLKFVPRERRTYLFSATMSSKVESLQRASLRDPVRVSISSSKYQTVSTLLQHYLFIPYMHKDTFLVYLVNEFAGQSMMIFTRTVFEAQRVAILLRALGFGAIPLHGQLNQTARLGALNKFRSGARNIMVATDVAARGLDIPKVDVVLNHDLPQDSKTYIHRVGRTARAGKSGIAITITNQYDLEIYQRIEAALGKKLPEYPTVKEEVMAFRPRVEEAQRHAKIEMRSVAERQGRKNGGATMRARANRGRRDNMDAEEG
ncbi:ATP-dependent RNA helicase DDX47/RRP3 [Geosmithia morbida]|uniref:ATP-dependent RNA helicase DDX47/RRP3 n=1 Tax=Geosmithia morbida TaxID=1094350 RepID=A0A9P5D023_9HYPO|nr:ATP-dependent RNA helicase DDX47/RRP3 [Geosmithia morbida]KAF4122268.1 ATP-dependent RNA helicase DDX47/RRP3 [Geosmithia morbida]